MINGDEGGQLSDFTGGDTVLMRGDIRLIGGIPPVPPTRENPDLRSLEQRAEQTLRLIFPFCLLQFVTKNITCVTLNP